MFSVNTVVMNVKGNCDSCLANIVLGPMNSSRSYKYNGDNCEYQYGFTLRSRGSSLPACDSSFENISLLLFDIQKILELSEKVSLKVTFFTLTRVLLPYYTLGRSKLSF